MQILLATTNGHKLEEIKEIFDACDGADEGGGLRIDFVLLSDLGKGIDEPVEDQATFEGNALLKARYYAEQTGLACLADDSGLEVDGLGGEPGVHSARYSGVSGSRGVVDVANNKKLMEALKGKSVEDRVGRFVCAMAYCRALTGGGFEEWVVRGTFEGRIILDCQAEDGEASYRGCGENGFGYDPLFWLEEMGCTSAQLTPRQKNKCSHRGQASALAWAKLKQMLGADLRGNTGGIDSDGKC